MQWLAILVLGLAAVLAILHAAYRPPSLAGRRASSAVRLSDETALGRMVLSAAPHHPHDSGVHALHDGRDAFGARVSLIRGAEVSLDIQYYIWQRDLTGLLLLDELRKAAARGVRIRLLLDDNGIPGLDPHLAELNGLDGVEVRLFNPFILRRPKALGYLFDFVRLNRRMHNKLIVADGAAAILGGRNIGDVYFAYGPGRHNIDTDVIAVGRVAAEAAEDFDRYWSCRSAFPAETILTSPGPPCLDADLAEAVAHDAALAYRQAVAARPLVQDLATGNVDFEWVPVTLISDDPAKGQGRLRNRDLMFARLMRMIADPDESVDIVSPYFVPGHQFTDRLIRLAAEGRKVRIFTNSQEATNQLVVHSAYVKYRPRLIDGGVRLFEMRANPELPHEPRTTGSTSSRATLHSKTVSVDQQRIFIGSLNFDPRSIFLNTEMGVMIESPRLAAEFNRGLNEALPTLSYGPFRDPAGRLVWHEPTPEHAGIIHRREPGTNVIERSALWLVGRLPIEWLL